MSSRADDYRRRAADLRVAAALLEEEARRLESADQAERVAAERAREVFEARIQSLTFATRVDTNDSQHNMKAKTTRRGPLEVTAAHKAAIVAANAGTERNQTPFARWLAGQGLAASDWARAHPDPKKKGKLRWSASSVRGWIQPAGSVGARATPEDAAELIAVESKGAVPATDETWPSGISTARYRRAR